jgi:hypothetical protein
VKCPSSNAELEYPIRKHKFGGIAVFVRSSIFKYVKVIDISRQYIYLFSIVNVLIMFMVQLIYLMRL